MLSVQSGKILTVRLDKSEGIKHRTILHKDADNIIIYYRSAEDEQNLKVRNRLTYKITQYIMLT